MADYKGHLRCTEYVLLTSPLAAGFNVCSPVYGVQATLIPCRTLCVCNWRFPSVWLRQGIVQIGSLLQIMAIVPTKIHPIECGAVDTPPPHLSPQSLATSDITLFLDDDAVITVSIQDSIQYGIHTLE